MSNLETPEDLLVRQRTREIRPQHDGEPIVDEFTPKKETSGVDDVIFESVEPTIVEGPASLGKIRWWDLLLTALNAYLGCFLLVFLFDFVGGVLYVAMGYGTDPNKFAKVASANFT